jgi:hypothetical protein
MIEHGIGVAKEHAISISDASKLFKLFDRLLQMLTGHRSITRKHFDEIVVPLFNELNSVVRRYHEILLELANGIASMSSYPSARILQRFTDSVGK